MRPKRKTGKNAQAALEYLMTYGWALVLIVTIASVLFVFVGGGYSKNTCQTISQSFFCKGVYADGDTVIMKLQNASARKITINPFTGIAFDGKTGYAKIIYAGQEYQFDDVTIPAGQTFEVKGNGMALAKGLSVTYTEVETGYTKTATVNLTTDTPPNTEISNDGIDNDKDGHIDCALGSNPANTACTYVLNGVVGGTSSVTTMSFNQSYSGLPTQFGTVVSRTLVFSLKSATGTISMNEAGGSTSLTFTGQTPKIGLNQKTATDDFDITGNNPQLTYTLTGNNISVDWVKLVITIQKQ